MSRYSNAFDDNFETVTGLDGKPTRILKDKGRVRISMQMRDVGAGSRGPRGEVVGDICTINGSEGRLRNVKGDLVCVPLKSQDAKPQITDGRTTDPVALQRPGWRIPAVNDRRAVHDAYARYQTELVNAYRCNDGEVRCPACFGWGEINGEDCDGCNGTGIMTERTGKGDKSLFGNGNEGGGPDPALDSGLTLDQHLQKHRQTMDQVYRQRDEELSNAWRTTK